MIPLTDAEHELLPIQFSVDPGEQFVWGRDEHSPHIAHRLTLAPRDRLGLLKEYLDVVTVPLPNAVVPAEENGELTEPEGSSPLEEEEIERRLSEVDLDCDENVLSSSSDSGIYRSKAAKQLQSVAKQFGSIGKSMSKKLKKNLGSITKMTRNNSLKKKPQVNNTGLVRQAAKLPGSGTALHTMQDHILCAVLHTEKRHEYQEEMVHNYLQSARARFERDKEFKSRQAEERRRKDEIRLQELAATEGPSLCINPGCSMYGTALTSYMCTSCYNKQKEQEQEIANNPAIINSPVMSRAYDSNVRYGAGRSRFYAESDSTSHELASRIPLSRAGSNTDQTLYLSKSTFYNDCKVPGSPALSRLGTSPNRTWSDNLSNTNTSVGQGPCISQGHVTVVSVNNSTATSSGENQSEDQFDLGKMYGGFKLPVSSEAKPCRTNNCKFFGCAEKDYYCSKCHKENQQALMLGSGRSMNIQEMRI